MEITDNFLTEEETKTIEERIINGDYFPWYYAPISSSEDYPVYTHIIVRRGLEVASDWYDFFIPILDRFVKKYMTGGEYEILRACLNDSPSHGKDKNCDAHVDFLESHKVIILYLTDSSGSTNIYDRQWKDGLPAVILNRDNPTVKTLKCKVEPKKGRMMYFDGSHYHSNDFKKDDDRRIICIFAIKY